MKSLSFEVKIWTKLWIYSLKKKKKEKGNNGNHDLHRIIDGKVHDCLYFFVIF